MIDILMSGRDGGCVQVPAGAAGRQEAGPQKPLRTLWVLKCMLVMSLLVIEMFGHYFCQVEVEGAYQSLLELLAARKQVLMSHLKQFEFLRELDETMDWVQEKEVLALSEDYGKDLEHVEVILQFDLFGLILLGSYKS